jgi:hypothetical protein
MSKCRAARHGRDAKCSTLPTNLEILANQFVENVVIELEIFPSAGAFDIVCKIGHGILRAADGIIANSMHDFSQGASSARRGCAVRALLFP